MALMGARRLPMVAYIIGVIGDCFAVVRFVPSVRMISLFLHWTKFMKGEETYDNMAVTCCCCCRCSGVLV